MGYIDIDTTQDKHSMYYMLIRTQITGSIPDGDYGHTANTPWGYRFYTRLGPNDSMVHMLDTVSASTRFLLELALGTSLGTRATGSSQD